MRILSVVVAALAPTAPGAAHADASAQAVRRGPPPIVRHAGIREARAWARSRAGEVAFAVLDDRARLRGLHRSRRHPSASLSKAMLLAAVVRAARDRDLTAHERELLRPMVTESDNDAAGEAYALVGPAGMLDVAHAAGMRSFRDVGHWSDEEVTAADQARLFWKLDHVLPRRHRRYARGLLAGIVPEQRWGIAPVAEGAGLRVLFKGGWRKDVTHQAARVERRGRRAAVAVLITGGPSRAYDQATIAGVARRLLARRTRRT